MSSDEFKFAAQEDDTCSSCKHNQLNKKIPTIQDRAICTLVENMQNGYYSRSFMEIPDNFLCPKYEREID